MIDVDEQFLTFHINSSLPFGFFSSLINRYFNLDKTILSWKYGMINRDSIFTTKICYINSSLILSVKALNPKNLFGFESKKHIHCLQYIYMEYYIYIKYLLNKYHISYDVIYCNRNI
jgi:hypothetical protein